MSIAQGLYERGYITYMRTDSEQLSRAGRRRGPDARSSSGSAQDYLPAAAAHLRQQGEERAGGARGDPARRRRGSARPTHVRGELDRDERALYELVWMRTVASQMTDARGRSAHRCGSRRRRAPAKPAIFRRRAARTSSSASARPTSTARRARVRAEDARRTSRRVAEGDAVACEALEPSGHTTQPPARYTEASLVKELEERAIGRPSTYASIIDTITNERGYVWKKGTALVPSWTAFAKIQLIERYFAHLVDYDFTATMEEALDEVAAGRAEAEKWLHAFYFGNGSAG